jgi:tRNA(Ile)-lysidine synthase
LLECEYKPRFGEILRRSARVIRDDYDLLCALRDRAWDEVVRQRSDTAILMDKSAWQALHPSLQRATLRRAVVHLRRTLRDVNFRHVEAAMAVAQRGPVGARATLPREVMLTVGYATLTVADRGYAPEPDFPALDAESTGRVRLQVPGVTPLPGRGAIEVSIVAREALPDGWQHNADPWCAYLDAELLGPESLGPEFLGPEGPGALFVRRRRPGDRFCPLGLGGKHKRVSDLLVNAKVPALWRDRIPLLVRADDKILWVCGWRLDERARVHDQTSHIAIVRLHAHHAPPPLGTLECTSRQ